MDETAAAQILHDQFYEWWLSTQRPGEYIPKIRHHGGGYATVPSEQYRTSLDHLRAELLPAGFRFTWANLPQGAHYVVA